MIPIKTEEEIKILREAGKILSKVLKEVKKQVKPGVSAYDLDKLAEKLIQKEGAEPAFKGYIPDGLKIKEKIGYPYTLCTSVNYEVVHGLPLKNKILKEGDIIGIDCGLKWKGYYVDMAFTLPVGKISSIAKKLIKVTKKALDLAIKKIKPGVFLGDISYTIQNFVEKNNFSVVRQLSGHGIGKNLHEEPVILNYGLPKTGPILKEGMVLAIEPMVNVGDWRVETLSDGWTVVTFDRSLSAHFEHTVLVKKGRAEILTK
jgi:methionyl aminopeptidase